MSDALATLDDLAVSDRRAYFEQRLFVLSPFGLWPTAALLFALFVLAFLLAAAADAAPLLQGAGLAPAFRLALVLALLLTTVLAVQRAARVRERADVPAMAKVLRGGFAQACDFSKLTPQQTQLGLATAIGAVIGLASDYLLYVRNPALGGPGERLWFGAMTLLLVMLFARGVELTRSGAKGSRHSMQTDLLIDLLRIENLHVWGRSAARFAVIWFAISAVACLLFVSSEVTILTVALLLCCGAMGIGVFVLLMERIHRRIRQAKDAELARIRADIDAVRPLLLTDPAAPAKLQGLLAYEARIMAVSEWPFDQTTAMRVGASALILTVPWFGQAVAAYLVEHLG